MRTLSVATFAALAASALRENQDVPRFAGVGYVGGVKNVVLAHKSAESRARQELAADIQNFLTEANRECCVGGTSAGTPEERARDDAEQARLPRVDGWPAAVVAEDTWKDSLANTYVLVRVPLDRVLEAVDKCAEMPK